MRKYSATVAYPTASVGAATSALRGALRLRMTGNQRPDWATLGYPAVLALALGVLSATVFRRQAPWIVDEL